MSAQQTGSNGSPWNRRMAIAGAVVVIAGVGWYVWSTYARYQRGLGPKAASRQAETPGGQQPFSAMMGPPSPEEREARLNQAVDEAGFTGGQKEKIKQIPRPQGPEDMRKFQEELAKVATPQQMEKLKENMRKRMEERLGELKKTLSPKDYEDLRKRMEERIKQGGMPGMGMGPGMGGGLGGGGARQ